MTTVVYVGPTLPASEVRALLPDAEVRPPVAVGEILAIQRVRRIAIIDGYFERMAAVWHKEILLALERGIAVWGASSMGALRAAELAPFGMRGVGAIYQAFARGELVADDEVAVAHLPADRGFAAVSDALVNLRHGLAVAKSRRVITAATHDTLLAVARARFYRERSWTQVIADGALAGVPRAQLQALSELPKPDLKADDARRLLRTLARDPGAKPKRIRVPRTWAIGQLAKLTRPRGRHT